MAVPFFRNAVAGDVLFTAIMFATPVGLNVLSGAMSQDHDHSAAV
jgi:hypothetical protein